MKTKFWTYIEDDQKTFLNFGVNGSVFFELLQFEIFYEHRIQHFFLFHIHTHTQIFHSLAHTHF